MNIEEKKQIVSELNKKFADAAIVILTDYKGLDVTTMNQLRKKLREAEVEYQVVKNSLMVRASENTDVALIKENFKGPSAIALGYDDPVAPAKVLTEFAKENDKLDIKVGVMKDQVLNLDSIIALSSLPSREQLLAQVLSAMNGVPTSLVRALNDVPCRLLNVLNALKEQKEAA
ncbi:MAG: 50S ribosomal protein L10 [Desulfobacteraceae bacterium]